MEGLHSTQILVKIKAGRLFWDGYLVVPEKTKGSLQVMRNEIRNVVQVCWVNRDNGDVEELIDVCEDMRLEEVPECTSGHVYVLRGLHDKKPHLYWIQEKFDLDSEKELINNFNKKLKDSYEHTISNPRLQLRESLEMALYQTENSNLLDTIQLKSHISINNILSNDVLEAIQCDHHAMLELESLMPSGQQDSQNVIDAMKCPQVQYTLRLLNESIYSDQLIPLLNALGLKPLQGISHPMEQFLSALEANYSQDKYANS
ncbi:hypothetical protein cand_037170 [Cryptosporidium andersoni]|uniref:Pru domain-containing protein n=1 Tax=Cryptosporidium andersoni TaxID=117008 RepID=A0A1J4MYR7_9CRYT|nr:hypothetical protein cand_037170 [Cryptosporidium andersoni]